MISYPPVERRSDLSANEFFKDYVGKKPVVLSNYIGTWDAIRTWDERYFLELSKDKKVKVKVGPVNNRKIKLVYLKDYIKNIESSSIDDYSPENVQYLHDAPLPTILDSLKNDMNPFPLAYLAPWYRYKWWRNLFFFYGAAGSVTPMHFDNLGTHNLFFHVRGKKKFIIVPNNYINCCYMHKYSWSKVNPEQPDFDKFPLFKKVKPLEAHLVPGDMLYMPPYTLHHVRSIDICMSMNIDWHTKKSVVSWLKNLHKGMAPSRIGYNMIYMAGILFGVPAKVLYPAYKHYLSNG